MAFARSDRARLPLVPLPGLALSTRQASRYAADCVSRSPSTEDFVTALRRSALAWRRPSAIGQPGLYPSRTRTGWSMGACTRTTRPVSTTSSLESLVIWVHPERSQTPPRRWLRPFPWLGSAWTGAGHAVARSTKHAKGLDHPFFQTGCRVARLGQGPSFRSPGLRCPTCPGWGPRDGGAGSDGSKMPRTCRRGSSRQAHRACPFCAPTPTSSRVLVSPQG